MIFRSMMSRILVGLSAAFFAPGLLCACESPLLHHLNADEAPLAPMTEKNSACPVELPKQGLCASWEWKTLPTDDEMGAATLRFWRKVDGADAGRWIDPGFTVAVKLWMPAMGHGSSPVTVQTIRDDSGLTVPGVFEASRLYFSMPGKWEIWIQLKQIGKIIEQGKLDHQA